MIDSQDQITTSVSSKRSLAGQLNNWRRNQQILTIFVLLFIAVIFWIIVSLFSSQRETTISAELNEMAQPLNPSIDDTVFDDLETRRTFSEEELSDFPIMIQVDLGKGEKKVVPLGSSTSSTSQVSPTPTPTPTATPSLLDTEDADL